MTLPRISLIALVLSLFACANQDGVYQPGCTAYEGDTIELKGGRFEWRRFTDERVVGETGDVAPPFPGFPKSGGYDVSDGRLVLVTDDSVRLQDWFIVDNAGRRYLLDVEQHNAFLAGGSVPECALVFSAADPR